MVKRCVYVCRREKEKENEIAFYSKEREKKMRTERKKNNNNKWRVEKGIKTLCQLYSLDCIVSSDTKNI